MAALNLCFGAGDAGGGGGGGGDVGGGGGGGGGVESSFGEKLLSLKQAFQYQRKN